ncbi:PREDICTED: neprilysin-1-like, partial [Rhagoletis zephyria]|uniref:neprilysin-1-like n=1 Tax=Rhagoletis zephyria TaxID=28612 RepID=UPI00081187BA
MQFKVCILAAVSALLVSCLEAVPLKEETFSSSSAAAAPAACSSAVCKETAKFFLSSMNATANPCDDFYEFACGAWRTKPIPEDKVQNWVLTEMDDHLNGQIRELLAKYNVEVDGKKNARAVTLAASAYQRCMQLKDNNTEGVQYIKELVDEVL